MVNYLFEASTQSCVHHAATITDANISPGNEGLFLSCSKIKEEARRTEEEIKITTQKEAINTVIDSMNFLSTKPPLE